MALDNLISEMRACTVCAEYLPLGPRPVFRLNPAARIILISQAPGRVVHENGIPWLDKSGERLRSWLGVNEGIFYDSDLFAILPMGFCYPGKGKSGDLPPRPECAPLWHEKALQSMPKVELKLLVGRYAQKRYLGKAAPKTLTETVRNYEQFLPEFLPLVHPSPLNTGWLKKNPWFEEEVVPILQHRVQTLINT